MAALGLTLAAFVGLTLGLLGGGGSILTVPIFTYVLGFAAKPAIAMSLPVVGTTSLAGALRHWRAGNVDLRLAAMFGSVAMLGAYGGARFARVVDGRVQLAMLAALMLLSALSMLRSSRAGRDAQVEQGAASPTAPALLAAIAVGVGVLTGLVGIGGGFLVVPALVTLARVPMKQAIGTSLVVIAMNAGAGFLGYLGTVEIAWGYTALFTAIAIAGILAGTSLLERVSTIALKRAFAIFLLVIGGLMLVRS